MRPRIHNLSPPSLWVALLIVAIIFSLTVARPANAGDNDLDPTFGEGGIVSTFFPRPIEGANYATRVQADGKIVMVGSGGTRASYFAVLRLNPDGTPDDSFGLNGSVYTRFSRTPTEAGSMAIQPDGKIIAAGYHTVGDFNEKEYALIRYNSDGVRDATFGNGLIRGNTGVGTVINAVTVLPDGKVLVAGSASRQHNQMWLARFNQDGNLDQTFRQGGMSWLYYPDSCEGFALAVQADGKILVGGECGNYRFAIVRTDANGTPDASFGSGGLVTTEFPMSSHIRSLGVMEDGRIVAVGTIPTFPSKIALARYDSAGNLDSTFGTGGMVTLDNAAAGYSLLLRPGGKILVPGEVGEEAYIDGPEEAFAPNGGAVSPPEKRQEVEGTSSDAHFALLQFDSSGNLDTSFGTGGISALDFGGRSDAAFDVVQAEGGNLVAGGEFAAHAGDTPLKRFAVARFGPNGQIASSFGAGGKTTVSPLESLPELKDAETATDNKLVALGEIRTNAGIPTHGLVRYNPDGSPDDSFGIDGVTTFTSTGYFDDVALLGNGNIVVGGNTTYDRTSMDSDFHLAQFMPDGQLNTAFGTGGHVTTAFDRASSDRISILAVQPDNKIVAYGMVMADANENPPSRAVLVRYNPDGSLDDSFGDGGVVNAKFGGTTDSMVIRPDGKILIAGSTGSIAVAQYNPDGSLDTTFGEQGTAQAPQGGFDSYAKALALHTDGKIVAVGFVEDAERSFEGRDGIAVRFNSNGSVDTTFGNQGSVRLNIADYFEWSKDVVVQPNGKPVIVHDLIGGPIVLVRLNVDGSLDTTFASGGMATTLPFAGELVELLTQANGKVVGAGTRGKPWALGFGLVRFEHDASGFVATATPISTSAAPTATQSNPAATATVTGPVQATPSATVTAVAFSDVPGNSPFYAYITCMASRNIISGYPCGGPGEECGPNNSPYFRPNNSMTRGQVAKIVANAAGYGNTPTSQTFEDVLPGSPFYTFIERMASRNIISGYECGRPGEECVAPDNRPYFRPNANVSRGQLTKIVSNARGHSEAPTGQTFEDVTTANAFYLFVERLVSRGVMGGYPCGGPGEPCQAGNRGYFRPGTDVTRGQASKIVGNAFFPNCQPVAP